MTRKDLRGVFTFEPDVDARRLIEAAQKDGPEPVPLERLLSRSSGG